MIKQTWLRWTIICFTGAAVYALTYASGQFPQWSQVFSMLSPAVVLACGILTGFPAAKE